MTASQVSILAQAMTKSTWDDMTASQVSSLTQATTKPTLDDMTASQVSSLTQATRECSTEQGRPISLQIKGVIYVTIKVRG